MQKTRKKKAKITQPKKRKMTPAFSMPRFRLESDEDCSLRHRYWLEEATLSGAIPDIVGKPAIVLRKRRPNLLSFLDGPKKKRKRLIKKASKMSPPLPPRI